MHITVRCLLTNHTHLPGRREHRGPLVVVRSEEIGAQDVQSSLPREVEHQLPTHVGLLLVGEPELGLKLHVAGLKRTSIMKGNAVK
jgi:hypothetical protein